MILVDANLLIYAWNADAPEHDAARDWLESLLPDAHLAALAMGYGLVLQTTDRDFARFDGLRWQNPLEAHRTAD